MKDLDERHGVKWAAPVAFGDRAGDSPIVGTTTSLVTFGGTVRPAEGRLFKAPFEAVVGASAPYRIGDEIVPMHGRTPAQDTRTTTDASRSWAGCPKAARPGTAPS